MVRGLLAYLLGKRSEIRDLDLKDVVMAKAILDIHRKRLGKEVVAVPLHGLRLIQNALRGLRRGAQVLRQRRQLAGHETVCVVDETPPKVSTAVSVTL